MIGVKLEVWLSLLRRTFSSWKRIRTVHQLHSSDSTRCDGLARPRGVDHQPLLEVPFLSCCYHRPNGFVSSLTTVVNLYIYVYIKHMNLATHPAYNDPGEVVVKLS